MPRIDYPSPLQSPARAFGNLSICTFFCLVGFFTIAGNMVKILERAVRAFKLFFLKNIKSHCSSLDWLIPKYCPLFLTYRKLLSMAHTALDKASPDLLIAGIVKSLICLSTKQFKTEELLQAILHPSMYTEGHGLAKLEEFMV